MQVQVLIKEFSVTEVVSQYIYINDCRHRLFYTHIHIKYANVYKSALVCSFHHYIALQTACDSINTQCTNWAKNKRTKNVQTTKWNDEFQMCNAISKNVDEWILKIKLHVLNVVFFF